MASISTLENKLSPGQTGCLRAGQYGSHHSSYTLSKSGTATGQITVTAAPDQKVTVTGYIDLAGSYITLSGLNIDGSNDLARAPRSEPTPHPISEALEINGHNDIFKHNNYYQSVPSLRSQRHRGRLERRSRPTRSFATTGYHDVGQCEDFDHLIYLSHGTNVHIYDNWMWNDPHGWGIQVYPAASGADIYNNVIDKAAPGS